MVREAFRVAQKSLLNPQTGWEARLHTALHSRSHGRIAAVVKRRDFDSVPGVSDKTLLVVEIIWDFETKSPRREIILVQREGDLLFSEDFQ